MQPAQLHLGWLMDHECEWVPADVIGGQDCKYCHRVRPPMSAFRDFAKETFLTAFGNPNASTSGVQTHKRNSATESAAITSDTAGASELHVGPCQYVTCMHRPGEAGLSWENTACPCGGTKERETMLCIDCVTAFATRPEIADYMDTSLSLDWRRHAAITLLLLAKKRAPHLRTQSR